MSESGPAQAVTSLFETVLPEGWTLASLGDGLVADVQPGFACGTNNREGQGIGHLRPMNVSSEGAIDLSDLKFVPASEVDREERLVRAGDVLFNNTNSAELVGKTACYLLANPLAFSNHMTRLRCLLDAVEPKFCAMQLHQRWREGHFEEVCKHHVSQASVGRKVLLETAFLLPPLREQKRIVAKVEDLLEGVNAARARLARLPAILKRFRQSVLAAACSGQLTAQWREGHPYQADTDGKPTAWRATRVGDLTKDISYGYTASAIARPDGPRFLRITDIQAGRVDWQHAPSCDIGSADLVKYSLAPGDIVFARTGATTGKSYLIRDCPEAVFASYLIRVRVSGDVVLPAFLYCFFQSPAYWQMIAENVSGNAQPGCNASKLAALEAPLPPLDEQREIVRQVESLFALTDGIEDHVREATLRAERLPQAILARAFRGELVPTEAELAAREGRDFESGDQLLARTREETAQQKLEKKALSQTTPRKKVAMKRIDRASVLEVIEAMPREAFSFDELRAKVLGDYDILKDVLFEILDDPDSGIVQEFDERAKAMRFRRTARP